MNSNTISPEQRAVHDLFPQVAEILNRHGVEYLAIGGNALRQHAPQKLLIEAVGGEEKAVEGPSGSKMPVVSGGTIRHEINPQKGANDIDFWVKPSRENALRLSLAMEEVQPTDKAAVQLLLQQLAKPECRVPVTHEATGIKIDLLSSVSGEGLIGGYDTARANSVVRDVRGVPIPFLSLRDCQINYLATGREKDLEAFRDTQDTARRKGQSTESPTPRSPNTPTKPDLDFSEVGTQEEREQLIFPPFNIDDFRDRLRSSHEGKSPAEKREIFVERLGNVVPKVFGLDREPASIGPEQGAETDRLSSAAKSLAPRIQALTAGLRPAEQRAVIAEQLRTVIPTGVGLDPDPDQRPRRLDPMEALREARAKLQEQQQRLSAEKTQEQSLVPLTPASATGTQAATPTQDQDRGPEFTRR